MTYNCNICNKYFMSNSGFWKHNNNYHKRIQNNNGNNSKPIVSQSKPIVSQSKPKSNVEIFLIKNQCKFCNKILSCKQSKYKHEKICKIKKEHDKKQNELIELENKNKLENDILKNEIEQLKLTLQKSLEIKSTTNILNKINKQKINKQQNNNIINNNNNTINIVKFGTEKLQEIFTDKQMFNLIKNGGSCINESIKYIHFNDKKPEYKNIFITNLKDKYAYVFDGDTFIIKEKNEVLDELLDNHAYNIKEFVEKNRDDLADHTKRSMDRLLNFIYDKNDNDQYVNFDKYKLNNIKLLVYNLSNNKNTNLINIINY